MNLFRYTICMIFLGLNLASLGFAPALRAGELAAAPEESFSIVVIPDTQRYQHPKSDPANGEPTAVTNPVFEAWTDWIVANIDQQKIA
ncbi:MAG: hypothetical protein KDA65_08880, partial [Planctomycetaceae bacterium]|nr:hypothetical protein [Planctomycetaceae bacterium]